MFIYEGLKIKKINLGGVHICVEKFVPADVREGVQMFQRRSKFSSEISSGGSIFLEKLVPGGTNLGGSIFAVTGSLALLASPTWLASAPPSCR